MMSRTSLVGLMGTLFLAASATAFEVGAVLKTIDAENRVLVVTARGQDRTIRVAKDAKFSDAAGKELSGGLQTEEFKEGTLVTLTVERENNAPVVTAIRLGGALEAGRPVRPEAAGGKASIGEKPLTEMTATDEYKGQDGGLYGGGRNEPPESHQAAAKQEAAKIEPLDTDGKPSKDGKIVLISISMSNATQEFSTFKRLADSDPDKSPRLAIVDCAQGGQAMAEWVDPNAPPWRVTDDRLASAGVSPEQVQIAWIKLANKGPTGDLLEHGRKLQKDTLAVVQNAKARFPNLRIAYLGSRIYAGYSTGRLNPEPYAYESAFVVRWLIQDQIKGEPSLNFVPERGPVKAPVLLWGPYFWADGTTPRKSDGLVWERQDLAGDGVHPSDSGRHKVAQMLLDFFETDALARTWFVKH